MNPPDLTNPMVLLQLATGGLNVPSVVDFKAAVAPCAGLPSATMFANNLVALKDALTLAQNAVFKNFDASKVTSFLLTQPIVLGAKATFQGSRVALADAVQMKFSSAVELLSAFNDGTFDAFFNGGQMSFAGLAGQVGVGQDVLARFNATTLLNEVSGKVNFDMAANAKVVFSDLLTLKGGNFNFQKLATAGNPGPLEIQGDLKLATSALELKEVPLTFKTQSSLELTDQQSFVKADKVEFDQTEVALEAPVRGSISSPPIVIAQEPSYTTSDLKVKKVNKAEENPVLLCKAPVSNSANRFRSATVCDDTGDCRTVPQTWSSNSRRLLADQEQIVYTADGIYYSTGVFIDPAGQGASPAATIGASGLGLFLGVMLPFLF